MRSMAAFLSVGTEAEDTDTARPFPKERPCCYSEPRLKSEAHTLAVSRMMMPNRGAISANNHHLEKRLAAAPANAAAATTATGPDRILTQRL